MKNIFYLFGLSVFIFLAFSPSSSDAVISEELLKQAGLQTVWQNAVALEDPPALNHRKKQKEKIERITVLGNYLYILTDTNYLFCLDRNTGRLSFAAPMAEKNLPVFEPAESNGISYLIAGDYIIAANIEHGAELYRQELPFSVFASAAVNDKYLYVPGTDHLLHVIDPNDKREKFRASADNVSAITSVVANDDFAIFATEGGNVMCMKPAEPVRIWQFDAVGPITAPLTLRQNQLYVGSKDTNLYKIDAVSGKLLWTFHSGSALITPAAVTKTVVYQYARNKGLYAIDANSGKQLWLLADGRDLLAQSGDTTYTLSRNNTCIVMDNKQGKNIYTINFAPVTAFAANVYDDKIYVMEGKNISCISPIKK